MSKRHRSYRSASAARGVEQPASAHAPAPTQAFTFGEPEPLDRRQLLDYAQCWNNGRWWEPPINLDGLANAFRLAPHHSSAIYIKRNLLVATFVPHPLLSADEFSGMTLDYLTFGNCYVESQRSVTNQRLPLKRSPGKYTRRSSDLTGYWFVPCTGHAHEFEPGTVWQMQDADVNQEVYGVPEYLSALHAAQLNKSATLFRRKYYDNGSHAGFILYMTDPAQKEEDVDALREALKNSKGPGNFRNLFMYSPQGKKDGIQLIPVSEVSAKDSFADIKNISRDDILAAHRVPPQLLGIIPNNSGGFGDVEKAAEVFFTNEIVPLQQRFAGLNSWLGANVVQFRPYVVGSSS